MRPTPSSTPLPILRRRMRRAAALGIAAAALALAVGIAVPVHGLPAAELPTTTDAAPAGSPAALGDVDLAALAAAAPRAPRIADHAAMEAALAGYAARALGAERAGIAPGAPNGSDIAHGAPARLGEMREPKAAASVDVLAPRGAVGGAVAAPGAADAALAPGAEPPAIDDWHSFDMETSGYLGSNGTIAAGPDAVLASVNGLLGAWDKDGAALMDAQSLDGWFGALITQLSDELDLDVRAVAPRAAYANTPDRFVLTAIGLPTSGGVDVPILFVGVSNTDDPSGRYCIARIAPIGEDDPPGLGILDYSLAVNDDAIALAVNLFERLDDGGARNFASRVFVEQLDGLLDCTTRENGLYQVYGAADFDRFNHLQAADQLGAGPGFVFVGSHDGGGALLQPVVMPSEGGVTGAPGKLTPIAVPSYTYPPDATQPGTDVAIATGWANVRSAVYLGVDRLYTAQAVDAGTGAGVAWRRLDVGASAVVDGGIVSLTGDNHLYHAQIMLAAECSDAAMIAFNYSGADLAVSAGVMELGADAIVPLLEGEGCVAFQDDPLMPWDQRVPIAYDVFDGLFWLHPSVAEGASSACTENFWATHVVRLDWDLCGTGPEPTPPPGGERKGIGFALGSKRFMRGIHTPGGEAGRDGAMRGAALTGIQVQNIDGVRTALPAIEFAQQRSPYGGPTGVFARTIEMDTIPPGASLNAYVPALDLLDAMYRVTITTPRDGGDLSAILRTDWDTGGAAIVSNLWFADRIMIPRVVRTAGTHTSVIAVTNSESVPVRARLSFIPTGSSEPRSTKTIDLAPAESLTFDLLDADPAFDALGDGFVGSAVLETNGVRVGAQVYEYAENSALAIGGYEGISAYQASSQLFVPLFRHQQRGPGGIRLDTAIVVANAGDSTQQVTVSYRPTTNASASAACRAAGVVVHGPVTILPNGSHAFLQGPGGGHGLPDDCFGSAVVDASTADGALVATVVDVQNGNEQMSMINASPVEFAATKHALPLFRSRHLVAEYTTGIQVMNTSGRPAHVTIDFSRSEGNVTFPITGCRGQCEAVILPYEAYTWWPPAVEAIPPGTYGAAVIESDEPIVVLVNDYPLRGGSDMATYAGIPVLQE